MPSLSPLGSRLRHAMLAPILILGVAILPSRSPAQYMYLDANGDGVNTAEDAVNPTGTTTIDVYLVTDQAKDGSPATCLQGDYPFTINSYEVILRSVGGTVSWGIPINRMSAFGVTIGPFASDTELYRAALGGTIVPPGTYRLMTVTATLATGAPTIEIVPSGPTLPSPAQRQTAFGSACIGSRADNTQRLGVDWFDTAGLPFGSIGPPNSPPTLSPIQDMTVVAGSQSVQTVTATDPDDQILTISVVEGPDFMTTSSAAGEPGAATVRVYADPLRADIGSTSATIGVSDGAMNSSRSFAIDVAAGPDHPTDLAPIGNINVATGRIRTEPIQARDPDGEVLTFSKASGPSFLTVTTLVSGPTTVRGVLRLAPAVCDAGNHDAMIAAGTGPLSTLAPIRINAELARAISGDLERSFTLGGTRTSDVTLSDFNRDGNLDIAITCATPPTISVLFGDGNGDFGDRVDIPTVGDPVRVASGDWNLDGSPDVGALDFFGGRFSIFFGRGDASFIPGTVLDAGGLPEEVISADVNGDGLLDIVIGNASASTVSLFLNKGGGAFGTRADIPTAGAAFCAAVADLNGDGRQDLAVGNFSPRAISVHLGQGDGAFRDALGIGIPIVPFSMSVADLNEDGVPDLAVTGYGGEFVSLLGDGGGGFVPRVPISGFDISSTASISDLNGDGHLDLALTGLDHGGLTAILGDGTGDFPTRVQISAGSSSRAALADVNGDAIPDFIQSSGVVRLNTMGAGTAVEARAFLKDPSRTRPGAGGNNPFCARVEPVNGSYMNGDVDYPSLVLASDGTGSVSNISVVPVKAILEGDTDGNGVAEISACFASADVAKLFDRVSGRRTVHVNLEGALKDGRRFCSGFDMTVVGTGGPLTARVTPNPLNPSGVLSFRTSRDGYVRVRMFDLNGRLVRVLADRPMVTAGDQEIRIDGRGARGETLATGAYFYVVETPEGKTRGRIMILK